MSETMEFNGPCWFLLCPIQVPHEHAICPECRAVRYGNLSCDTCKREAPIERAIEKAIARANDRRSA